VAIIEEADAFQLSEIHKLRGRVGRNGYKGYCLLMSDSPSKADREGLYALEQIPDGITIAEVDLELRGLDDVFGARQIGLPIPRMAKPSDLNLLAMAREEAHHVLEQDPDLTAPEYVTIAKRVQWPTTTMSIDKD
jgi:ATP-dependent DNA helicase RecG